MEQTLSKLAEQTNEFTSAWDERHRTFERLRNLRLDDEQRKAALDDYVKAAKRFDDLRTKLVK